MEEEEDELFSLQHMAEALDIFHKLPLCAEPKPLKSCLKSSNMDPELKGFLLASTISSIFPCQKRLLRKNPSGLPKLIYFRLTTDDPTRVKSPISSQNFIFLIHLHPRILSVIR